MAWKALKAGLIFLIWREALSSEEPVGGASGPGVTDGGVAAFVPQKPVWCFLSLLQKETKRHGHSKGRRHRSAGVLLLKTPPCLLRPQVGADTASELSVCRRDNRKPSFS